MVRVSVSPDIVCGDSIAGELFCVQAVYSRDSSQAPNPQLYGRWAKEFSGEIKRTVYYNCSRKANHRYVSVSAKINYVVYCASNSLCIFSFDHKLTIQVASSRQCF